MITDDGVNWKYVENNMSSDISWRKFAFRVSDYVNLTADVQLKFIASDSIRLGQNLDGGSLVEAAVDDLVLYEGGENTTFVKEILADKAKLIKVTNLLGKIVDPTSVSDNITLFYIYDDGRVEKRLIFD